MNKQKLVLAMVIIFSSMAVLKAKEHPFISALNLTAQVESPLPQPVYKSGKSLGSLDLYGALSSIGVAEDLARKASLAAFEGEIDAQLYLALTLKGYVHDEAIIASRAAKQGVFKAEVYLKAVEVLGPNYTFTYEAAKADKNAQLNIDVFIALIRRAQLSPVQALEIAKEDCDGAGTVDLKSFYLLMARGVPLSESLDAARGVKTARLNAIADALDMDRDTKLVKAIDLKKYLRLVDEGNLSHAERMAQSLL